MKACSIFVFAVVFLALSNADEEEMKKKLPENLRRILAKCEDKDAEITPFNLCIHNEFGIQNSNGDIDKNILKTMFEKNGKLSADVVDKAVAECGERNGTTAEDAANALEDCMVKYLRTPGTIFTHLRKRN